MRSSLVAGVLLLVSVTGCTKTANITDLYMSLDSDGNRKRNEFFTDTQEIHCIGEVSSSRDDATITLRLRSVQLYDFEQQKFFDSIRMLGELDIVPPKNDGNKPPAKIDAQLRKSHAGANSTDGGTSSDQDETGVPYDAGRFVCEAWLDKSPNVDAPDMSTTFNVLIPPCPDVTITAGSVCYGFYDHDAQCPKFGQGSSEPAQCRCDKVMGWVCP